MSDQYKLKLKNKHIGLREIHEGVFEPKNDDILRRTVQATAGCNSVITVVTYFYNNVATIKKSLQDIELSMISENWNLIIIDNGSTDGTYNYIQQHKSSATNYLHFQTYRMVDKDRFEKVCMSYAKEYLQKEELLRFIPNTEVEFEGQKLASFCFMATEEVAKEAALLVYSIRCYHSSPIYVVCDDKTKDVICTYNESHNIFFECSADEETLSSIASKHTDKFIKIGTEQHKLECIYHKMRAIEFALENESNTLFTDSDIIIASKFDQTFYKKLVLSPHYWGSQKEYGVFNAGYLFCADKAFVNYWRDLFITKSTFCEQEAMNYFSQRYDIDIFDPGHNHGFWRPVYELTSYKSFHNHLFGLPAGRKDPTAEKQEIHRQFILNYLDKSESEEHNAIYTAYDSIRDDRRERLPSIEGKVINDDWATVYMNIPVTSNTDSKIRLDRQTIFQSHRSGWSYAMESLLPLHNNDGIKFDGFLENNFAWVDQKIRQPYTEPWVGIFHNPQNIPDWFFGEYSVQNIIKSEHFQNSLQACRGLFAMSRYHADYINKLTSKPVSVLYHPTEVPDMLFDYQAFLKNSDKRVVNIGYWLRKLNSIYSLKVNGKFEKWRLIPYTNSRPKRTIDELLHTEREVYDIEITKWFDNTRTINRLSNQEYDTLLSQNIVFLDLYDSSANNAIIECIARGTPIVVNPIPGVVEYLGVDYPLYFNTLDEAAEKINDFNLIRDANEYLMKCDMRSKLSQDYFRQSVVDSEVYKLL